MQKQTYNLNIESALLSSLIFNPDLLKKYAEKMSEELFFQPQHRKIFTTINELYSNGKQIDEEILHNILGDEYENILINILASTPLSILDGYIEVLQDLSVKREIQRVTLELGKALASGESGIKLKALLTTLDEEITSKQNIELLEIEPLCAIEEKEVEFIVKSWLPIPKRTVSLVTAPGGTGKSWFIMQLAIRAILEKSAEKVFLWLSEDPKEVSKHRFRRIMQKVVKSDDTTIEEKILISDSPTIQFLYEDQRRIEVSPLFLLFKSKMASYDLIILDPLIAFYGTDENNNSSARRFMQLFTDWANKENKTIIFIHHSTKNTTQSRGASAFVDAVRTVYEIDRIRDKDGNLEESNKRLVKLTKDNYGISTLLQSSSVERELFPPRVLHQQIEYQEENLSFGIPNDF